MTNEQFEKELSYQIGILLLQSLKSTDVINDAKICQINCRLNEKFLPIIGRF